MTGEQLLEVFIMLFIGMGPVKVLFVFMELTQKFDADVRRQMTRRIVTVAGGTALGLFAFGAIIQQILHFSIGALTIAGGLILLILAIGLVMGGDGGGGGSAQQPTKDPISLATSPLAIPLMLNPIGIVVLVVLSTSELVLAEVVAIVAMIMVILLIDYLVLSSADRVASRISHATIELFEKVMGILLAALAVELILIGIAEALGIAAS